MEWKSLAEEIATALATDSAVAAVVGTGSSAGGRLVAGSDLDLFVYSEAPVLDLRRALAERMADPDAPVLIDVDPFGHGDVWRERRSGIWLDLMHWSPQWAEDQLDRVLVRHEASLGYTTAFWRSIATGVPVYERDEWHPALQARARAAYPPELADAIVDLNAPWLQGHPFSFRHQVAKAVARDDGVSLNHRLAAWLASYFDVLFAVNHVLHPGEKRLVEIALQECPALPTGFVDDVDHLLTAADPVPHLDAMTHRLEALLVRTGLPSSASETGH